MTKRVESYRDFPYLDPEGIEPFVPGGYYPIRGRKLTLGGVKDTGTMPRYHADILRCQPKILHLDACMLEDDMFGQFLQGLPKCTSGILISRCSLRSVARADALVDFILSRALTFSHLRLEETGVTYTSILKIIHALKVTGAPVESFEMAEKMLNHGGVRESLFEVLGNGRDVGAGWKGECGEQYAKISPRILRLEVPHTVAGTGPKLSPFPLYMWVGILERIGGGGESGGATLRVCIPSGSHDLETDRFIDALGAAHGIETLEIDGSTLGGKWARGRLLRAIARMRGLRRLVVDKDLFCEHEFLDVLRNAGGGGMLESVHVFGFYCGMMHDGGYPKDWVRVLVQAGISWPIREFGRLPQVPGAGKVPFQEAAGTIKMFHGTRASVLCALLSPLLIPRIGLRSDSAYQDGMTTDHVRMVAEYLSW